MFQFIAAHWVAIVALASGLSMLPMMMPPVFGASLTVEAPVLTWQRVDVVLNQATPGAQALFRGFKSWIMQQKAGMSLQFIPISDQTVDTNPLDGAIRVYAVYLKKQPTATDAYFKVTDDATDDTTADDQKVTLPLFESGKESIAFFPDGIPLAAGLVTASYTAPSGNNGTTATTAGDGPNGFLLVGA